MGIEVIADKIENQTLTDVLEIFIEKLEVLPQNLENPALKLLMILTVLDITWQVFKVEEINWNKWLVQKIMRVGLLIWIIKSYDWLLTEIINGFIMIGEIGFGKSLESSSLYIKNPSLLIVKAGALGEVILKATKLTSPRTWANLILWAFLMIGFFFIAFSIIIIWIEFYLLTGIGIMFIPFGTLKTGETYFQNVCKIIVGCGIKMCVLNSMILLIQPILENLKIVKDDGTIGFAHVITVVMILAYMTLKIPDIASGFLSGTPGMNAAAAMSTGMAAVGMALGGLKSVIKAGTGSIDAAKGAIDGARAGGSAGAKVGGNIGGAVGGIFGAAGAKIGNTIGSAVGGTVGGVAYSAYSAAKLGTNFKNKDSSSGKKTASAKTESNTGSSGNNSVSNAKSTGENNSVNTDTGTTVQADNSNVSAAESTNENNTANTDTGTTTETNGHSSTNTGTTAETNGHSSINTGITDNKNTAKSNNSEVSTDTGTERKAKLNGKEIDI